MEKLSLNEGMFLVKLSRKAVEKYLMEGEIISPPKDTPEKLREKYGVFVTLEKIIADYISGEVTRTLRGCIGYPEPTYPLVEATIDAAIAAATKDPRFPPVRPIELKDIIFEVSILTPPKLVRYNSPDELKNTIEIGKDGIIIESGIMRGLLLPQVPVEYNWSVEEFLDNACLKAGLRPNIWREGTVNVYIFQAQIFAEIVPNGEVIERVLTVGKK